MTTLTSSEILQSLEPILKSLELEPSKFYSILGEALKNAMQPKKQDLKNQCKLSQRIPTSRCEEYSFQESSHLQSSGINNNTNACSDAYSKGWCDKMSQNNMTSLSYNHPKHQNSSNSCMLKEKEKGKIAFENNLDISTAPHPLLGCSCDVCHKLLTLTDVDVYKLEFRSSAPLFPMNCIVKLKNNLIATVSYLGHERVYRGLITEELHHKRRALGVTVYIWQLDYKETFISLSEIDEIFETYQPPPQITKAPLKSASAPRKRESTSFPVEREDPHPAFAFSPTLSLPEEKAIPRINVSQTIDRDARRLSPTTPQEEHFTMSFPRDPVIQMERPCRCGNREKDGWLNNKPNSLPNPDAWLDNKRNSLPNPDAWLDNKRNSLPNPDAWLDNKRDSLPNPDACLDNKRDSLPNPDAWLDNKRDSLPNPDAWLDNKRNSLPNPDEAHEAFRSLRWWENQPNFSDLRNCHIGDSAISLGSESFDYTEEGNCHCIEKLFNPSKPSPQTLSRRRSSEPYHHLNSPILSPSLSPFFYPSGYAMQ